MKLKMECFCFEETSMPKTLNFEIVYPQQIADQMNAAISRGKT